ncbi:MAG: hypothetical protein LC649_07480 [Bacteroidales bacterium]|nr:hypothetical protein [Bacteroidales bacterium]
MKSEQNNYSFRFNSTAIAFLQPSPADPTRWEQTQPSYEEHYQPPIIAGYY